jgi:carbon starvation protein
MKKIVGHVTWGLISVAAAFFLSGIALNRDEPVNSMWLVLAAVCTYLVGYRFYGKFIAAKVMVLNDKRATPAEPLNKGRRRQRTD